MQINQSGETELGAEASKIYAYHKAGKTYTELAEQYGTTKNAIAGVIYRFRHNAYDYDPLPIRPLKLTGDRIVAGDVHVPCTDWEWARRVVLVGQKLGIKRLTLAGDIFNMDAFSSFSHTLPPTEWRQERDSARAVLGDWLDWFETIEILMGNHDRRMEKWAGGHLDEADIFGMIIANPRITTSQFGWCTLTSGGIPWRITHPRNFGRNQLTVSSDLANKFQTNIISFHEHHLGMGWDVYGRWVVINGGCLVDPEKLAYVQLDDSRQTGMVRGFVAVKNGCATVYGEKPFSEW